MPGRHLFATAADLLPGLARFEQARPVRYFQTGLFDSRTVREYDVGAAIPDLGFALSGDAIHEPAFLVVESKTGILVRDVPQRGGGTKFAVDQLHNPNSTVFRPGGLYQPDVLIAGLIATAGTNAVAVEIQALMVRAVTKEFRHIGAYWVGPEALSMLEVGARLTEAVQRSRRYDLQLDAG